MKGQKRRIFKLASPLKFELKEPELVVIDKFSNKNSILLDNLEAFNISNPDSDGFVLFEVFSVATPKPGRAIIRALPKKVVVSSSQAEAEVNGYTLFETSPAKSTSYGTIKSVYEYYKRRRDLSYYAIIRREGSQSGKKVLGSLLKYDSRIFQMARIIHQNFRRGEWFDRKKLSQHLPPKLTNRRIMKCILDILTAEKFLEESNALATGRRGGKVEVFSKTENLEKLMVDPRSFLKPNGVNVGQRALISDR